jgi:hypothetical protein
MSKQLVPKRVDMFKMVPRWGKGPFKVVKVGCAMIGKSLLIPVRGNSYTNRRELHDTPRAAIKARLKEIRAESEAQIEYAENYKKEVKLVEALLADVALDEG